VLACEEKKKGESESDTPTPNKVLYQIWFMKTEIPCWQGRWRQRLWQDEQAAEQYCWVSSTSDPPMQMLPSDARSFSPTHLIFTPFQGIGNKTE
jgi:hypothetical protein